MGHVADQHEIFDEFMKNHPKKDCSCPNCKLARVFEKINEPITE